MPIIILEGIDGAGKSTLAEKLIAASPIPARYEHRGPMEGSVQDEYIIPLLNVKPNELLIADRWHVGEMIYGPIYRGKSEVFGYWNRIIEGLLTDMGAVKVIVAPPLDVVKERLQERGEDYLQPEHVDQVYNLYEEYCSSRDDYHLVRESNDFVVETLLGCALGGVKNVAA